MIFTRLIAKDVEPKFDISSFQLDRPSSKEENKNLIRLMKDELGDKS